MRPELRKRKEELGYYIPNRFEINLSKLRFPIQEGDTKKQTVFLHEYMHLVQNMFSISGWQSFANEIIKSEAIIELAIKNKEIIYPVREIPDDQIPSDTKHRINIEKQYFEYLFDDDDFYDSQIDFIGKEPMKLNFPQCAPITNLSQKPQAVSEFSIDGVPQELRLSYSVIIESMAYIVEKYYNIENIDSPDYPYKVLSKIFDKTPLKDRLDMQICMLYISLQSSLPDVLLKSIFEFVIKESVYREVDIKLFSQKIIDSEKLQIRKIIDKNLNFIDSTVQRFLSRLAICKMADNYHQWLNDTYFEISRNLRNNPLTYIVPVLEKQGFDVLLSAINNNYFLQNDSTGIIGVSQKLQDGDVSTLALLYNSSFFHFVDFVTTGIDGTCPLFQNCNDHRKDAYCTIKSYEKGTLDANDTLCNYGQAAYFFGTNQYKFRDIKDPIT